MATIRISQLTSVGAVTADDFLLINDADTNTRKISFENFSSSFVKSTSLNQTITGNVTVAGTLAATDLNIDSGIFTVVSSTNNVGIGVAGPAHKLDVSGDVQIRGANKLLLADTTDVYTIGLKSPSSLAANFTYTLPTGYPSANGMALVSSTAGATDWAPIFVDPLTTAGDIVIRNLSNVTTRLGIGTAGQTLTVTNGVPAWADASGGGGGGAKGQKGEVGAGVKGQKGEIGSDGQKGQTGASTKGQKGQTGSDGAKGQKGLDGSNGTKGEKGAAGTNGTNGAAGSNGTDGAKGQKGVEGVGTKGQKGQTGAGTKGQKGIKGEGSGVFTFKGNVAQVADLPATGNTNGDVYRVTNGGQLYVWDGTQWIQMGLGAVVKGQKGDDGIAGTKGQKGQDGAQGTTGSNGTDGAKGQKGLTGTGQKGEPGVNGSNGNKGQKGITGATTQTTPAGANTQVQFNDNGAAGANSSLTFTGTTLNTPGVIVAGSATLGSGSSNSINMLGNVISHIIPSSDNFRSLGSSSARWKQVFVGTDIRFSTSVNTSRKIKVPNTYNGQSPRGLAIGDIDIHTGAAGTGSTWVGAEQGENAASADHVTALGFQAGGRSPGNDCTMIGYQAGKNLQNTQTVNDVTAVGSDIVGGSAVFITTCHDSVLMGSSIGATFSGTTRWNVFLGSHEKPSHNGGTGNVFIGTGNSTSITGGSGCVMIGGVGANGVAAPVYNTAGTANNIVALGSTSVANAYIQVAWTVVSDKRDKVVMGNVPHGLDFVDQLQPVTYQFKRNADRNEHNGNGQNRYGFLAQDVLALEGERPVIIDNNDEDKLRLTSDSMIPVLVNAIKELKAEVEALKNM